MTVQETEMKVPTWIQAISGAISTLITLGLLLLVVRELKFYDSQLLDSQRGRKIDKMDALYEKFNSLDMLSVRSEAAKSHPSGTLPVAEIYDFFERLARAEQLGIVDADDIDYYFRDVAMLYWYGWQDWLKRTRIDQGEDPEKGELYQGYQRLVGLLLKRPGAHQMNAAEIQNLLKYEAGRFERAKALRQAAALSTQ